MLLETIEATEEDERLSLLYQLLAEREEWENISHKKMPTFSKHRDFVLNYTNHYEKWFFIKTEWGEGYAIVGAVYVTKPSPPMMPNRCIGIAIFKSWRKRHFGSSAVKKIMGMYELGTTFCANIAPNNYGSQELFERLGFIELQRTYKITT